MSYTMPTDAEMIRDYKAAIAQLTIEHKKAVTPTAKRQITALIKRYQKSLARLQNNHQ